MDRGLTCEHVADAGPALLTRRMEPTSSTSPWRARARKAAGNRVLSVIAGRTADLVILEDEIRQNSDEVIVMTDDGSRGEKGVVTVGMEKFIEQEHIDRFFFILYKISIVGNNLVENFVYFPLSRHRQHLIHIRTEADLIKL